MLSNVTLLGLVGAPALIVIIALIAILAFEIAMFVSAIRNRHITGNVRWLWIVGMLLLHPFVAIVYYFTDYKKS